ncbi:MAG: hypothetical protein HC927_14100, partial [Deltaproteobacteria bacterium]|nr:hypothetical protein [Deltaproteobacteria bacterium]
GPAHARARSGDRTFTLIWLGTGAFIYYNTNILNRYLPSDELEELQARYEREYKQYEDLPQPRITAVAIEADLYPYERRVEVRGTLRVVNKTDQPITDIHVPGADTDVEVVVLDIPGATLTHHDEELDYRIFTLASPMQPGDGFDVKYDYRKHLRGFGNEATDTNIVANGTFINSFAFMPHFGYSDALELSEPNDRRKHGLPERLRMPKIDASTRARTHISARTRIG